MRFTFRITLLALVTVISLPATSLASHGDTTVSGDPSFGTISFWESVSHTFTYTYLGPGRVSLSSNVFDEGRGFHAAGPPCDLGTGESCERAVTFSAPSDLSPRDRCYGTNLRTEYFDAGTNTTHFVANTALSGCTELPQAQITPLAANFGDVAVDGAATRLFQVENVGNVNLQIKDNATVENPGAPNFDLVAEGYECTQGLILAVGESCQFYVVFSPVSPGPKQATLKVYTDDDPDDFVHTTEIPLQGNGGPSGYPRPKGTGPISLTFVPAFLKCQGPTRTHGQPLASPSCYPPAQFSHYLTVGTPDANGRAANSVGSERVTPDPGDPSTAADEADVTFDFSVSDVRNKQDLSDYLGELQVVHTLRITDKDSGISSTVTEIPFPVTAPCVGTGSTSVGSACSITTTADTLIPGAVQELQRTVWEVAQVRVTDGGEDGDVDTADNTPFLTQGVFVP